MNSRLKLSRNVDVMRAIYNHYCKTGHTLNYTAVCVQFALTH